MTLYVLGHVDVPVRMTSGGTITKRGSIAVYGDDPRFDPPLVALALNPQMVDWLIDELRPRGLLRQDGFVDVLEELRDEMKVVLWERVAS